jgi:formylglycine-generating enzyme required for sulfatase activity
LDISKSFARELIGSAFPKYQVLEELGAGSFGTVFKVKSDYLERAVKIIPLVASRERESGSVTSASECLTRDWRYLVDSYARLRCPEVVDVLDFHLVETAMTEKRAQAHGLVMMELYPGNLEDWVFDDEPTLARRVEAIIKLAAAFDLLERKRGFHLEDLKPENVLVRDDEDGVRLVVGDIGGLKSIGSVTRASTGVQVSLNYAAPEVVRQGQRPNAASVVFAFGLLAFFVLEGGRLPFKGESIDDRFDLIRDRGPDFEEAVAPEYAGIRNTISRCSAFAVEDRYPDFASVAAALLDGAEAAVTKTEGVRVAAKKITPPMSSETLAPQDGATIVMDDLGVAPEISIPTEGQAAPLSVDDPVADETNDKVTPAMPILSGPVIVNGRSLGPLSVFRDPLKDGAEGPEMVVIPSGSFLMGSPQSEKGRNNDEEPQHEVLIGYPFAVGKYPVTQEEWRSVMGNNPSRFGGERHPVEMVNWNDAKEFVERLSAEADQTYRLLSEAEWEYVARAGSKTAYHTGERITTDQANFDGNLPYSDSLMGDDRRMTVPVGYFSPNTFGLHDVSGNVWEWVEDCWHDKYASAPVNGEVWTHSNQGSHVLRGASWCSKPRELRSARRGRGNSDSRFDSYGFRVARTI